MIKCSDFQFPYLHHPLLTNVSAVSFRGEAQPWRVKGVLLQRTGCGRDVSGILEGGETWMRLCGTGNVGWGRQGMLGG